jgi:hypothetical protein
LFSDYFPSSKDKKNTFWKAITTVISVLVTFHFVVFCWIFFRAKDFTVALDMITSIGELQFNWEQWAIVISGYENVFIMIAIGYALHFVPAQITQGLKTIFDKLPMLFKALILALTFWLVAAMASSELVPFIYFQF